MYWTGKGGPRFIRPIRWIVALLGDEIVPFELAGVRSGAVTSGHRRLGAREIAVTTADYEQRLARSRRDPLRRRAPQPNSQRNGGHPHQARRRAARNAGLPHRVSDADPAAASTRSSWNCPKKC